MATTVVNTRRDPYDIYIGRWREGMHFGNPFSHLTATTAICKVANREEAIIAFKCWLEGDPLYAAIEPERREWIINNMHTLKGKVLGCFCKPLACHGDIYVEMLDG